MSRTEAVTDSIFMQQPVDPLTGEAYPDITPGEAKALGAIVKYIDQPPENSRVFTITPLMARHLVEAYNKENRPRKPTKIRRFSIDMAEDSWGLTGDTLKFSDIKRLRDGQNRLFACIEADTPFRTHIVFGIDDDLFAILDRGRPRSGGDVFTIAGIPNAYIVQGAVRWVDLIVTGRIKQRSIYEPADLLDLYKRKYAGIERFVSEARRTGQPAALMTALLYLFDQKDPADAADFAAALASDRPTGRGSPAGKAKARLAEIAKAAFGRVHEVVRAVILVRAWNLFRQRRKGTQANFKWERASDPFPTID